MKLSPLYILLGLIGFSCSVAAQTMITYQSSSSDFANPERGFYRYSETRSSNYTLLNQSTLEGYRQLHTPPTAAYSIYSTLVFRYFFLEDFKSSNISQSYLDNIQADFNTARAAGVKLIPRFAYTDDVDGSGCSSWICPPYGDASKAWVLTHIQQLKPLLTANKDVIAAVQMGLIGVWGENYYTDYFGDASQAPDYKLTDQNWTDRIEVLNALLDAVPVERMLQVRYPQQKQRGIYGINAPTNSNALILSEAFQGTDKSRIGFHNDCLLASSDDFGTYTDYGNSSSSSSSDTTHLKPYLADDSQFVVVGGETCDDGYSPENDCASSNPSAFGDTELERMHYSYLNSQYNNAVNNDWQSGACMDEIKKRLGYRFELQDGLFSNTAQPNQVIDVTINLKNLGYASPYNERGLELILRNTATSDLWFATLPDDPRYWFADNTVHQIMETLCIPPEMPPGTYELLLNLPDPMPTLYASPSYAIRLANRLPDNSDVWEPSTGYNQLGHTLTIDLSSSNLNCNGETTFTALSSLPIDLLSFSASPQADHILIEWTTTTESNNRGFDIERSVNGKDFSTIAWRDGQGSTDIITDYQVMDSAVKPNINYYYRLTQRDWDGTITHSKIVTARIDRQEKQGDFARSIHIYPNPTHHHVTIDWDQNLETVLDIRLLNLIGHEIVRLEAEDNILRMNDLPSGVYIVKLRTHQREYRQKVIKW